MENTVLEKLWAVAQEEAEKSGSKQRSAFGEIGLFLEMPPTNWGYYPTPTNTSTFASTLGDSVHYGLLHFNGEIAEASPVIMTVPCNDDKPNFVLGESLLEFLCLGCKVGYFGLEQLAYRWEDTIGLLSSDGHRYRESGKADKLEKLNVLTQAFSLKPWEEVQKRLEKLHETYHPLLKLPPKDW